MGGPLTSAQRHGGELGREPALSGRPANPPPPNGESEEEGDDAEGDASPAPAPQAKDIPAANDMHMTPRMTQRPTSQNDIRVDHKPNGVLNGTQWATTARLSRGDRRLAQCVRWRGA